MNILQSLFLFIMAGLAEIGGGYMMWLWLKKHETIVWGLAGALVLAFYGVIPTLQTANFGRVYAAYGGVFVVMSLLWGWFVDKIRPDFYDWIGGLIVLLGIAVIMYWPRGAH